MKIPFSIIMMIFLCTAGYSQEKSKGANLPEGYGDLKWGTEISKAKSSIKGRLSFTDDKKVLISNDGDLEYYYGFFYVDPARDSKPGEQEKQTQTKDEGRLYYVAMKFPYLALKDVRDMMEKKYGSATGDNMKNNQGALTWDSENSVIILWVDRYEGQPFSRRITYISKKIAAEMNKYQSDMFNKAEIEILKKLNP